MFGLRIYLIITLVTGSASIPTAVGQEQVGSNHVETSNPEAYDAFLRGWEHYSRETPADFGKAAYYFEQAIQLDPDYAHAHTAIAAVYWNSAWRSWTEPFGVSTSEMLDKSRIYLKRAKQSPLALTHQVDSEMAAYYQRSSKKALAEADAAIALDTNDPAGHLAKANALLKAKKPAGAITEMQQAMQLNPHYPSSYLTRLGRAQFALGNYSEATTTLKSAVELNPEDDRAFVYLAAAYGHLGHKADALSAVDSVNRLRSNNRWGNLTIEEINRWRWTSNRKRLKEGLVLAGVESGNDWYSHVSGSGNNIEIEGATGIGIERAKQLYDAGIPFIDVSTIGTGQASIPGTHNLRWGREKEMGPREFNLIRLEEVTTKSGGMVVHHPNGGNKRWTALPAAYLTYHGFKNVYYLQASVEDWKKAGYPMESD